MNSMFWHLDVPHNQRMLILAAQPVFEKTPCPVSQSHSARFKRIGDLHVIADRRAIKDFTWTWENDVLISPKVLSIFQKHQVTGFEVRPAVATYPEPAKEALTELYEVVVTGWAGFASRESGLSITDACPACGYKRYSIAHPSRVVDPNAWDGSDIFIVWPLPRWHFASDRLANIIRQEKLSGINLVPASAAALRKGAEYTPGSLFEWMPEKRAAQLGERFGIP